MLSFSKGVLKSDRMKEVYGNSLIKKTPPLGGILKGMKNYPNQRVLPVIT